MASITCRHGGTEHTHQSVAEVKLCQGVVATVVDRPRINASVDENATYAREAKSERASEPGFYKVNGIYYKVQYNQDKTRVYAKRLEAPAGGKMVWVYDRGGIYSIKASHKITPEQATEFGKLFGNCIRCFRDLTREESIRRGYGPTCADHEGWPYDHSAN